MLTCANCRASANPPVRYRKVVAVWTELADLKGATSLAHTLLVKSSARKYQGTAALHDSCWALDMTHPISRNAFRARELLDLACPGRASALGGVAACTLRQLQH